MFGLSALVLAACGGGGATFTDPVNPEDIRAAAAATLDVVCQEVDGSSTIKCDNDEEQMMTSFTKLRIQVAEESDGSLYATIISVQQGRLERKKVVAFLKRFGFSEDDFLAAIERGQRITQGDFTLYDNGDYMSIYSN
ncbi:hypothetical protein HY2_12205 [Hyphomonas pacifica]|nr:hypothetical protein HY2_12205 [Hyphomonas pacifica]